MLMMTIAGGIAYTYKNYELKKKKYGSIGDVFTDAVKTFKRDLRLIKPPKTFVFTPEASNMELRDMKQDNRESMKVRSQLEDRLSQRLIDDYF